MCRYAGGRWWRWSVVEICRWVLVVSSYVESYAASSLPQWILSDGTNDPEQRLCFGEKNCTLYLPIHNHRTKPSSRYYHIQRNTHSPKEPLARQRVVSFTVRKWTLIMRVSQVLWDFSCTSNREVPLMILTESLKPTHERRRVWVWACVCSHLVISR